MYSTAVRQSSDFLRDSWLLRKRVCALKGADWDSVIWSSPRDIKPNKSALVWQGKLWLKRRDIQFSMLDGPQFWVFYQGVGDKAWLAFTV